MSRLPLALLLTAMAGSALAQDANDGWDVREVAAAGVYEASVTYAEGVTLTVQCVDDDFAVRVTGLSRRETRGFSEVLKVGVDDAAPEDQTWISAAGDDTVFASRPAPLARRLREARRLQLVAPGANGAPDRRYRLDLPGDSDAIDHALTACERPVVDPRDSIPPAETSAAFLNARLWRVLPSSEFPSSAARARADVGVAYLTCIVQPAGGVGECVVESEFPAGLGFGREALRSVRRARLVDAPGAPGSWVGRRITFSQTWRRE